MEKRSQLGSVALLPSGSSPNSWEQSGTWQWPTKKTTAVPSPGGKEKKTKQWMKADRVTMNQPAKQLPYLMYPFQESSLFKHPNAVPCGLGSPSGRSKCNGCVPTPQNGKLLASWPQLLHWWWAVTMFGYGRRDCRIPNPP
jgi:hypothetical protein